MFKVNEYFDGTVKSIAFQQADGEATIGVMAPGKYNFGTADREIMHVVSGSLKVLLPGSNDWETFNAGQQQVRLGSQRRNSVPLRIPQRLMR